ncbi:MAG: aspartate kinase [Clostridia bacterium]|nr:aspartate kinase [Clostridia bacterium]
MSLVIQKFGGSSVADTHHIFNVAKKITDVYKSGNDVVAVVSAQGDTTDKLQELMEEITDNACGREKDVLLSSGEQVSSSLLAMAVQKLGFPAVSLTGWQAGFLTESNHTDARIIKIDTTRIKNELKNKNIVIVAGFQGIDENGDITTLGRGGSDTSAVALAAALNADICKIYTDVDGVYTADPRSVVSAKKWSSLSYDTMFEMAHFGAQVLNERSIETAKKFGVTVEVLSSLSDNLSGTVITKETKAITNTISGISLKNHLAKVTVSARNNTEKYKNLIMSKMDKSGIKIDSFMKSVGKQNKDIFNFIVEENHINDFLAVTKKIGIENQNIQISYEKNKSEISVINISESLNLNTASIIFETLSEMNIDVEMVACDEKRVSVVVASECANSAVNAIHSKLFEEDMII